MRVMVIVKANKVSEAGILPSTEILAKMGKYNEELVKAGVMLAGEGLQASSKGKRVRFSGEKANWTTWSGSLRRNIRPRSSRRSRPYCYTKTSPGKAVNVREARVF